MDVVEGLALDLREMRVDPRDDTADTVLQGDRVLPAERLPRLGAVERVRGVLARAVVRRRANLGPPIRVKLLTIEQD